jgi:hypothetical protein
MVPGLPDFFLNLQAVQLPNRNTLVCMFASDQYPSEHPGLGWQANAGSH